MADPLQNTDPACLAQQTTQGPAASRLHKHADYQRVYRESQKHFSSSITYFFSNRAATPPEAARVGLTAGRVLGKAVDRNRLKRRMRHAVRLQGALLPMNVDVVLHPRRKVLTQDFRELQNEVAKLFRHIRRATEQPKGEK